MHCYRHPENEAYVRCQRCERFICPKCQVEAAVGFLCPEDAGITKTRETINLVTPRRVQLALAKGSPLATYTILGICVALWLGQLVSTAVTANLVYWPLATAYEPWRMITSAFVHDPTSPLHILLNMWSLWVIGRQLEGILGTRAFVVLYLLSALGGSVGFLLLGAPNSYAYGASGAIFGVMGALFVVMRSEGLNTNSIVLIVALNLGLGFMASGIAWQAHVGGLLTGAAVTWVYSKTRGARDGQKRALGILAVGLVLVALTIFGVLKISLGY